MLVRGRFSPESGAVLEGAEEAEVEAPAETLTPAEAEAET
jgi:hypothetical protein